MVKDKVLALLTARKMWILILSILVECHLSFGADLVAHFDQANIRGTITITQQNENDDVKMFALFELLPTDIGEISWRLNAHPTIYNPQSPDCNDLGDLISDLGAKHGFINKNKTYTDNALSIVGKNSILGKSIVLLKAAGTGKFDVAVTCATILPTETHYAKVGISDDHIAGSVEFLQYGNRETMVYGHFSRSDSNTTQLDGVELNIYKSNDPLTCSTLTDIYNPTTVMGSCTTAQETTCKVGDLKSKFGAIYVLNNNKFFFLDKNLPLFDTDTIVGQSLAVKLPNGHISCSKIMKFGPREVQAAFTPAKNRQVNGHVRFTQASPYNPTKLEVSLNGLSNLNGYHVHLFPIEDLSNPSCSPASVGGHLNPYGIVQSSSPPPNEDTVDLYEIGDLSGKFGGLKSQTSYQLTTFDLNLPLYGSNTIIGRSVVIHSDDASGTRFTCSNIQPVSYRKSLSGNLDYAIKEDSKYNGFIHINQYVQSNDVYTPTTMVVKIDANNGNQSNNHNWHVHIKPVGNDTLEKPCSSAGPHYNPAQVNVAGVYVLECNAVHPYRCEVGDTSKKVGTYNMGGGKEFFADYTTPLFGDHSVLGRSIVFHAKDKGAARVTCADIIPDKHNEDISYVELDLKDKKLIGEHDVLKDSIGRALGLQNEMWKVTYLKTSASNVTDDCFHASVYILDNLEDYQEKINEILNGAGINHYRKCEKATSSSMVIIPSLFFTILTMITVYLLS